MADLFLLKQNNRMCSHRLSIAKLVRDYKDQLFSHSNQISRQDKQELWEFIRQKAVTQGAIQYARKSWKEIRDSVWAPIRRDTMAKVNKAKMVGEDSVLFTEIDRIVIDIVGSNGGGIDDSRGGSDFFNDENSQHINQNNGHGLGDDIANLMQQHQQQAQQQRLSNEELSADFGSMNGSAMDLLANCGDGVDIHHSHSHHNNKPGPSLTQMLEMFRDPPPMLLKHDPATTSGNEWPQQMVPAQIRSNSHHQQQQQSAPPPSKSNSSAGTSTPIPLIANNQPQQHMPPNPTKRKATESTFFSLSSPSALNATDLELDRAIKRAKLEQIQLQNTLLHEQIEEKRLQNRLLRMGQYEKRKKTNGETTGDDADE